MSSELTVKSTKKKLFENFKLLCKFFFVKQIERGKRLENDFDQMPRKVKIVETGFRMIQFSFCCDSEIVVLVAAAFHFDATGNSKDVEDNSDLH